MNITAQPSNAEVRAALDELRRNRCDRCQRTVFNLARARADLRIYLHRAAHAAAGNDYYAPTVEKMRAALCTNYETALLHLSEPHADPQEEPAPPPRGRREPKPDDRVECPTCGGRAKPKGERAIAAHRSPTGGSCPRRLLSVDVPIPPVSLPPAPSLSMPSKTQPRRRSEPSRLDAGSECRECGKWLPGERSLCGRCYATRRP